MKINVLSVFPEIFDSLKYGVVGKAITKKLITIKLIDLKEFSSNSYGSIDDSPYGGGAGMVMSPEPISNALKGINKSSHIIYLSPQGKTLDQKKAKQSQIKTLLRYKTKKELKLSKCGDQDRKDNHQQPDFVK